MMRRPPSLPCPARSHRQVSCRSGRAASDGRYERNLVHELTQSTGMRNVIPPESLARFVSSSSGLSEHVLVPILFEKLEVRRGDARGAIAVWQVTPLSLGCPDSPLTLLRFRRIRSGRCV